MRMILLAPLALALSPAAAVAAPGGSTITVAVAGIGAAEGKVHVDICPEASFLQPDCGYSGEAQAVAGTTVVTVANVPPGRYASAAYWDANGNGKADRNLIGLPIEQVGFSNDVRVKMSKPKFADCAFTHAAAPQKIGFAIHKIP
ncbi:DUF2141 domain-containing protein [Sphingomonas sp.]|uniref:DUF2141 domain-containing protein n=1 Tax=Sphingomonas sp. TaxID=28214 RepID=UPI003B0073CA